MENNILLSIIIPAYNCEKYIEQCLNSIYSGLNEDEKKRLEVIVVNDCSSDNTESILMDASSRFKNLYVFSNKDQKGVSASRNLALEKINGTYIAFCDADDYFLCNPLKFLEESINTIKEIPDIIIFDYQKHNKNQYRKLQEGINLCKTHRVDVLKKAGVTVWNKFYKSSFIKEHNLQFINNIYYEDIPFTYKIIMLANTVFYIKSNVYFYRKNPMSIMHTRYNYNKYKDIVIAMDHMKDFFLSIDNIQYKKFYILKVFSTYCKFLKKLHYNKKLFFDMQKSLYNIDLSIIKVDISLYKYYTYKCLQKNKYVLFICLNFFKLF